MIIFKIIYNDKYLEFFLLLILGRMATEKMKKNEFNYVCKMCDFNTYKKTNYNIHLQTQKHQGNILATSSNNCATENNIKCDNCNKIYINRTGLWRHKKKCINIENEKNEKNEKNENTFHCDDPSDKQLIMMLIKENSDFKNLMLETFKNSNNTTNNTNISNNKTFNLNLFLNETCKDAMNIMDFVDSIKLQLCDLENVGKLGYTEGISNIIIKNLNNLEIEKRPVHCTDSKREVLYVKDENQWYNDSKDQNENKKIKKAIKHIAYQNTKLLPEFKAKYPDCVYSDSKKSDQYNKIIIESLNDSKENENKIIKKIAKEVSIDKI